MYRRIGFSLVEMLMALLVASLLMAALAPVITRRFSDNINVTGSTGGGRAPAGIKCWNFSEKPDEGYNETTGQRLVNYEFEDVWYLNFIIVSGGGGGAAATESKTAADTYTGGDSGLKITYDMDDFEIDFMTGGGGGGGSGAGKYSLEQFTASDTACNNLTGINTNTARWGNTPMKLAVYDSVNNLCVTRFNQIKGGNYTSGNCYTNYTHGNCNNSGSPAYDYTGCQREICTHAGAAAACKYLNQLNGLENAETAKKWRLPTYAEIQKWNTSAIWKVLNLCDYSENTLVPWCGRGYIAGAGASAEPAEIWAQETNYRAYLMNSKWNYGTDDAIHGARCVIKSARIEQFYSLSGGKGSSAPKISGNQYNSVIKETLNKRIRENIGGTIVFEIGEGGEGGDKINEKDLKANDGKAGKASCIIVKSTAGAEKYRICVPGGNGGYGADGTVSNAANSGYGKGGETVSLSNACWAVDSTVYPVKTTQFDCTEDGLGGANGTVTSENPASADGNNGTVSGEGGYGGAATKTESATGSEATLIFGKGGNGVKGSISLKYKHKFEAAGGGGGGGGTLAVVNNVLIGKKGACEFKIGRGGAGGKNGANGLNGGNSSVRCNEESTVYEVYGAEGGKAGMPATTEGGNAKGGPGGVSGLYNETIAKLSARNDASVHKGLNGISGGEGDNNYQKGLKSAGGRGGTSGTGKNGTCGGIENDDAICNFGNNPPTDVKSLSAQGFSANDIVEPTAKGIAASTPNYGEAGAGGGGGAWYMGLGSGDGGSGMGGYVCVYWQSAE